MRSPGPMKVIPVHPFFVIGLLLFIVGSAWLLYGVPFEDPFQDWVLRSAVFISGLFLVILYRKKSNTR